MVTRNRQRGTVESTPAGAAESWLKRLFVEDLGLKSLALVITLVLWFAVSGQHTNVKRQFHGVQLAFRTLPDMEISDNPRDRIELTVSGSDRDLSQLNPADLLAVVDLTDRKPGERVIQLTPARLRIERLPEAVHLESVEPGSVMLTLEPRVERELPVQARVEGNPAPTFELGQVVVTPGKARVRGPASHVNALQKAITETISVEGRRESFDLPGVGIYIADPQVEVLDTASVHIEIVSTGNSKPRSREPN